MALTLSLPAAEPAPAPAAAATEPPPPTGMETVELGLLNRYLATLAAGQAGQAIQVDEVSDLGYPAVAATLASYLAATDLPPASHLAYQNLLERLTRVAAMPPAIQRVYAARLLAMTQANPAEDPASQRLLERLLASELDRQPYDLAVRLCSRASLAWLRAQLAATPSGQAPAHAGASQLLAAWNRRLSSVEELRELPEWPAAAQAALALLGPALPPDWLREVLRFALLTPGTRVAATAPLRAYLRQGDEATVLAALAVQERLVLVLDELPAVFTRFPAGSPVLPAVCHAFAFEPTVDHAATLRQLYGQAAADDLRTRRAALFAMAVHHRGNAALALAAIREGHLDLLDVSLALLGATEDGELARPGVALVLERGQGGLEEALRVAQVLRLDGFAAAALAILEKHPDQIVRQSALRYLAFGPGAQRQRLLPWLSHANGDLRLGAIQAFGDPEGLSEADLASFGPALARVVLNDPSMGHRQEALHAMGRWDTPTARPVFEAIRAQNPLVSEVAAAESDAAFWQYRLRVVALLGLARLQDQAARDELEALHRAGGPARRMDLLLVFDELAWIPEAAWEDLDAIEPKLVATAARLIQRHGGRGERSRLHQHFKARPLYRLFPAAGLDDHNILDYTGLNRGP